LKVVGVCSGDDEGSAWAAAAADRETLFEKQKVHQEEPHTTSIQHTEKENTTFEYEH
jgi:hypothetical protein